MPRNAYVCPPRTDIFRIGDPQILVERCRTGDRGVLGEAARRAGKDQPGPTDIDRDTGEPREKAWRRLGRVVNYCQAARNASPY